MNWAASFKKFEIAAGLLVALGTLCLLPGAPAFASAFWGGTVKNLPAGDHLNIRKWPSPSSQVSGVYRNGERLSMTGRCKNINTGISFRIDGPGTPLQKYNKMRASYVWCQIRHEPTPGNFASGWGRGRYMWPQ